MPYPHQFIKLTPEEKKQVSFWLERYVVTGQHKKRRRLQVLWLSDEGLTYESISQRIGLSYQRVRELIYLYRKAGLNSFI